MALGSSERGSQGAPRTPRVPMLALDIGGTKTAAALVRGPELISKQVVATPAVQGPEAVTSAALGAVRALLAERGSAERPALLGVACAGVVNEGRVRAMSTDLMPGWHDFPLVPRLEDGLSLKAYALNDAQAAAYGESVHGAGQGSGSLLFVTVSTGVGGGLVLGGRVWSGATGLAGHLGHVGDGVLERLTSGTALARRAAERGHAADAREVIAAAAEDAWAAELLTDAVKAFARALLDVKLLVDPELVVLGGSVGLNPTFRRALEAELARSAPYVRVVTRPARLGADAGLIGAAAWAAAGADADATINRP